MDLIDMQSLSYNDYRYIMVYQDNMTKFVVLWPLKSKRATDVAMQILDIFLVISFISAFARSRLPWLCGCLGFP
jgi:hypothetical protein